MKVFGIGMQRTGTTSLVQALNVLKIKTRQFPSELFYDIDHAIIREFDGFADNPIPLLYKELDEKHPNSKFIHTTRDEREWLKSVRWLFTNGSEKFDWQNEKHKNVIHEMHTKLYGTATFDEATFLEKYRAYNRDVHEYFANRPDDVLEFDVTRSDGFDKLCPFLNKQMPDTPFPHQNKSEGILKGWARRILQKIR